MITATVETKDSYLTHEYGVKSWLLTQDHKRIGLLYLAAIPVSYRRFEQKMREPAPHTPAGAEAVAFWP